MLHRVTSLFASLYGRFSTICVKQHSAGKRTCRMAFALLLVPLFVVPSFAMRYEMTLLGADTVPLLKKDSSYVPLWDSSTNFYVEDLTINGVNNLVSYAVYGDIVHTGVSQMLYQEGLYVDVLFYGNGEYTHSSLYPGRFELGCSLESKTAAYFEPYFDVCMLISGVPQVEVVSSNNDASFTLSDSSGSFRGSVGYRFTYNQTQLETLLSSQNYIPYLYCSLPLTITDTGADTGDVVDRIEIIIGQIDDIGNNIEIISVNITDIKNQFENSNSNIWNAFGEKVESLVVPSEQEMQTAIDGFNGKVKTKLGGLYDAFEIADNSINNFVSAFGVSTADTGYGFDFPGLSFPMNGSQITILPAQTVYIENAAFRVFSDLLGNLVAFLCALAAFHISEDALICFLSGVSYWGFIRGRHDR